MHTQSLAPTLAGRVLRLLLCSLPIFATWICFVMIQNWHPTTAAYIWATITALISVSACTLSLVALIKPMNKRANRLLPPVFYLSTITGLSIAITRALLPWEEPGTGMGSPLAVLIGLVIYAIFGIVIISLPMLVIAQRAARANEYLL